MIDEKLLLKLLEDVMVVAEGAYWGENIHCDCGGDLNCAKCKHEEVCRAQDHFNKVIAILREVNKL